MTTETAIPEILFLQNLTPMQRIYETEREAARAADIMAEQAADEQREYEEKEQARIDAETEAAEAEELTASLCSME